MPRQATSSPCPKSLKPGPKSSKLSRKLAKPGPHVRGPFVGSDVRRVLHAEEPKMLFVKSIFNSKLNHSLRPFFAMPGFQACNLTPETWVWARTFAAHPPNFDSQTETSKHSPNLRSPAHSGSTTDAYATPTQQLYRAKVESIWGSRNYGRRGDS